MKEGSSGEIGIDIRDKLGVIVPLASIETLTFTLRDERSWSIINSRNAIDIKSVYTDAGGVLPIVPADNIVRDQNLKFGESENHVAIVKGTAAGDQAFAATIVFSVERIP